MSIRFERVAALGRRADRRASLSLELGVGTHALVVPSGPELSLWAECAVGIRVPRRGRVRIFGRDPSRTPAVRAAIGSAIPSESSLADDQTLAVLWELARAERARHAVATQPVGLVSHEEWSRCLRNVTPGVLRRFELELALSVVAPLALVLCEPLRDLESGDVPKVLTAMAERARRGAVVLSLATSEREARYLADQVHALSPASDRARGGAEQSVLLVVDRREALAARLEAEPEVLATELDPRRAQVLRVFGTDSGELVRVCLAAAAVERVQIFEMTRGESVARAEKPRERGAA